MLVVFSTTMSNAFILSLLLIAPLSASGSNDDLFNYGNDNIVEDGDRSYGQPDWGDVTCSDIEDCVRLISFSRVS